MQQREKEKWRQHNRKREAIYRASGDRHYALTAPKHFVREKYPWELAHAGKHPKVTKEFFRCKGSSLNPPHLESADPAHVFDCGGFQRHSLPIRGDKEFIYPVLIELLNYVQETTGCKVVITCGHRCPTHNGYADPSVYNRDSKHMIGAEVDFYVQGMESRPEEVVALLMRYYEEQEKKYAVFQRFDRGTLNVVTPAWYNEEVFIKLYTKSEGRDVDNRHPYPYLSIQVRYDKELKEKVMCDWKKAFYGYRRH
jgi:hypothetical protein